ncbi:J domain-containing protein required for chloroplast accumulation response 1-like isoform X2 [Apium graveolens]|uniref:J domain-containing protein required for chloroplast accumulation response 1-like isoform X2 n=1 Tax=Apium graveolens TaxID=4045 RepID=UPI003D7B0FAE
MKRENRRDNILLDYSARRSVEGSSGSPVTSSDDIDFKDVFGGPPRRFSYHETTRYSSDGAMDVMETARSRSLSSGKPVFGERGSSVSRRTHQRNDFFDDIFQGVKSRSGSGAGSAIMGPYEPFGTSVSARLSHPSATLNKDVNNPTLASTSSFKKKEDTSNGISSSKYSISRFSSQGESGHDLTSNVQQSNCPGPLSTEVYPGNKETSYMTKSDEIGLRMEPKSDSDYTEAPNDIEDSHFSIYKWAGGEVPIAMPSPDWIGLKVDENPRYLREISKSEKTRKEVSMVTEETPKPVAKTLHSFLQDNMEAQDDKDTTLKTGRKVKATKVFGSNDGTSNKVKRYGEKKTDSESTEVNKGSNQRSSNIPEGNAKRSGVRGKVKDFVKKFNQENNSKPKSNFDCGNQNFRSEGKVNCIRVDSSSLSTSNIDAVMQLSNLDTVLDALFELDENVEQPESNSPVKSTFFTTTENSSLQNDASPCSESIPDDSEVKADKIEDHFRERKMMQDVLENQVEHLPISEDNKANALDAEVLKWSTGKEGNIRSLISTLQYVLWEESGWKPVPLVDIIELNAVKKSYQKAMLCLHPDKLQQKGADSHQKYIAERVFDILQEAWDHFNTLDPL